MTYYSVHIPYVDPAKATIWHPHEKTGPFATLSRGCFKTTDEAAEWALTHLDGAPYTIVTYEV